MNDERKIPNEIPEDSNRKEHSEGEPRDLNGDGQIYPPRDRTGDRYRGYESTGYGGVHSEDVPHAVESDDDVKYGTSSEETPSQESRDYGVDPFASKEEQRQRPYGMTGTYEWNFDDYDQQSPTPPSEKKPHGKRTRIAVIGVFCVIALFAVFFAGYSLNSALNGSSSSPSGGESGNSSEVSTLPGLNIQDTPSGDDTTSETTSADGILSDKEIIRKVSPAVVGVECYSFGNSFTPTNSGSGIIMTADGYIVTNAHVVEDALGITVLLENGDAYTATLIGSDTDTDLAVLKIDANNLTYAEFGNSDALERGDRVIAIGNPGGTVLAGSTTGGMVSGLNRKNIGSSSPYSTSYIQVDAAINPGNSGGALVNAYGQVIGINSAKIAEEDYEGIGFAIPINEALPIIQELMEYGHVTGRAALGVQGYMINEAVASMRRLPVGFGIEYVDPSSDLASKNVVAGDIITQINGIDITSSEVLTNEIASHSPGDTVTLTIYRSRSGDGRSFEVSVTLIESTGD